MAELKITANITQAQAQLKILDKNINDLKKKGSEIEIKIKGADTLQKLTRALNRYSDAEVKAARALTESKRAEVDLTNARTREINALSALERKKQDEINLEKKIQLEKQRTATETEKRVGKEVTANAKIIAAQQRTQQELIKSEKAVKQLSAAWKNMFSQLSMANIISSGVTRAISTMRSAFHEALQEMKALDLAATHYQQVMGSETNAAATGALTQRAYSVGSKYGTAASDYMESVATYARAGYKQAAESLAELSMKTVIVGQTTQEVADQFLLAMDAAYGYEGSVSELSKVLDGASAIDSSYATTIEKIATGLGLVAPLAEQVHVSEAELTAAIGTITAATQRSGSEAARALRSLFLNIIKDTTTEIEEGVTATEDSIASVSYLLQRYASSAVQAAEATGQVINPMEAIAALSKSMQDGLLTEQKLMELLSGIGGKLRISQLVALISNWDMYTKMIGTYENAIGSADEKTEKYLDSWEAKTNILKNTWTEFIANSLNTNTIKGLLDGATKLLKNLGSLGNALKVIAGIWVTINLAKGAAALSNFADATMASARKLAKSAETLGKAREAVNKADFARLGANFLNWATVAVGAITAVVSAYNAYHSQRMQHLQEERDEQIAEAETQKESFDKINEAYEAYLDAKQALDDNKISTEEYETAVYNLATALGVENEALAKNVNYLERKKQQQEELTKKEIEDALAIARITANTELNKLKLTGNYQWMTDADSLGDALYVQHFKLLKDLDAATSVEEAIPIYNELLDLQEQLLEASKGTGEAATLSASAWQLLNDVLPEYAAVLKPYIQLEEMWADATMTASEKAQKAAQNAREAAETEFIGSYTMRNILMNSDQWDKYFYKRSSNVNPWERHYAFYQEMDEAKTLDELTSLYTELVDLAGEYNKKAQEGGKDAEKYAAAYDELVGVLSIYAPLLESCLETEAKAQGKEYTSALQKQSDTAEETAKSYHALADAIQSATDALADYDKITSSEKDDNYKKYAEAWEKAFEDIKAGKKNSNAVNAALDLFFTPEQILYMRKRGLDAANLLASDFYKAIFTYMDEEGNMQYTKGADSGSLLAYYLWDSSEIGEFQGDGKKVIKLGDDVAATLEEVDGQLQINVTDVDMLSKALDILGYSIDPDILTGWLESLSMFSDGFTYSADVVKEFAENVGALKDGKVDLEALIAGQLDLGRPINEVIKLYQAAVEMAENGDLELTVSNEDLDATKQSCEDLITATEDLGDTTAEPTIDVDTTITKKKLDDVEDQFHAIAVPWTASFSVQVYGMEQLDAYLAKMSAVRDVQQINFMQQGRKMANGYASGTTNASGGLALVNEEAPELILENGAARIAGSGMPTLTRLASGATVFNARETRAILGGAYPSALFDGINAYASGTKLGYNLNGITRWTAPSSGSSSSTASNVDTSSSSSSSYSAASAASAAASSGSSSSSSSSSDKDPQLEALENIVKLLKSELSLIKERGESLDVQIDKQREIQKALQDQIYYLGTIGGDQEKINSLWTEYWKIENEVRDTRIELAKGELAVIEAAKLPIRDQIEKQREIATIYKEKLDILQQTGGSQIEINNLLKEELAIQEAIAQLNKGLMNDLSDAIDREIDALNEERDTYIDTLQKEIDALNEERDAKKEINEEEELNQQLIKARNDLMNAQNQRTVRQYNAATGQWELVADAQSIKSAQDAYDSAMKALVEYQDEAAFNAKIDALVAEQERYTELYAEKTDKWQEILDSLEDPLMTIAEALQAIEDNATKDMQGQIEDLNKLLNPLGYAISTEKLYDSGGILSGIGGIKATARDEAILPPDITARLLKPIQPAAFEQRMNELRYLYGASGSNFSGSMGGNVGSMHNGDLYTFGNVTLTTEQAQNTTIYDFVQAAKGLRSYSARM